MLGLVAWILPIINLARRNRASQKSLAILSVASVGACAVSLCLQIFYTSHLVKINDWAALLDTSYAVAVVSKTLIVITLVLNAIAFSLAL